MPATHLMKSRQKGLKLSIQRQRSCSIPVFSERTDSFRGDGLGACDDRNEGAQWNKYCAELTIENEHIPPVASLKAFIEAWDFSRIAATSVDIAIADAAAMLVLSHCYGADFGPALPGVVLDDIQAVELPPFWVGHLFWLLGRTPSALSSGVVVFYTTTATEKRIGRFKI